MDSLIEKTHIRKNNNTITMALSWIWILLLVLVVSSLLFTLTNKKKKRLPPGPTGIPILGHLHMLGKNPHQDLLKISNNYGPIVYMRFGLIPHIIVSSPQAAELFLKTHDLVFASRPPHQAAKIISWDQKNVAFGAYGPYWRNMRKLCTLELLSSHKINSFQSMRTEEVGIFVESLKKDAREHTLIDLGAKVASLSADMSCRMVFGRKYEDRDIHNERGFTSIIQEGMRLGATPNLVDFFPFLGSLDLQGLTKKMKVLAKVYNDFFEKVIDDYVRNGDQDQAKSFVGTMMSLMGSEDSEFQLDRGHVKSVMLDMLAASMDTSAATTEWVIAELIKNPRVMEKVQKELEQVIGMERHVNESDLDELKYLDMVMKETFRLHPVAPMLLPHYSMEDIVINGYDIPKESRVLVNTYAIGRDPNVWKDPEMFVPERFIGSDIDVRGQHFQLLPFGSGRRGCPGLQLGLIQVRLIVAQLVHCFNWELPDGMKPEDLDMNEKFGIVVARDEDLKVVPTYRLHN